MNWSTKPESIRKLREIGWSFRAQIVLHCKVALSGCLEKRKDYQNVPARSNVMIGNNTATFSESNLSKALRSASAFSSTTIGASHADLSSAEYLQIPRQRSQDTAPPLSS